MQVIKGTYTQTDQLQGFNALAPTAGSKLNNKAQSGNATAQVPSNSIIEALSSAAMADATAQVCGIAKASSCLVRLHGPRSFCSHRASGT